MAVVGTRLALYSGVTNVNQTQEAKMTKQAKKEYQARMDAIHSESLRIRNTGKCPVCGAGLRDNLSLAGYYTVFGRDGKRVRVCIPND